MIEDLIQVFCEENPLMGQYDELLDLVEWAKENVHKLEGDVSKLSRLSLLLYFPTYRAVVWNGGELTTNVEELSKTARKAATIRRAEVLNDLLKLEIRSIFEYLELFQPRNLISMGFKDYVEFVMGE